MARISTSVKINKLLLDKQLRPAIEKATFPVAKRIAREKFNEGLDNFIKEIEDDPVSQEIIGGTSIERSRYIKGRGSRKYGGNIFSFFGFKSSREPIKQLVKFIRDSFRLSVGTRKLNKNNNFIFPVIHPTEQEIKDNNLLDWTNRSWITAVERGISNVTNYIMKKGKGRSEGGWQIEHEIDKTFVPTKNYFSQKYSNFINFFKKKF